MFNALGVALYRLLGTCPVFLSGTGRKMSSDELTNFPLYIRRPRSNCEQLLPVPFRS